MAFLKKSETRKQTTSEFEELSTPDNLLSLAKSKGLETEPLNVSELASLLGIIVRYEPMQNDDSGSLKKERKTGIWIMTINSLHHPHRQRFTIAHEIAHRIRPQQIVTHLKIKHFSEMVIVTGWKQKRTNLQQLY